MEDLKKHRALENLKRLQVFLDDENAAAVQMAINVLEDEVQDLVNIPPYVMHLREINRTRIDAGAGVERLFLTVEVLDEKAEPLQGSFLDMKPDKIQDATNEFSKRLGERFFMGKRRGHR